MAIFQEHQGSRAFAALVAIGATLAAALVTARDTPAHVGVGSSGRIVGGTTVSPYQAQAYSAMAAVVLSEDQMYGDDADRQFCGGSLIAPRMVLTAAHCVVLDGEPRSPQDIGVVLGKRDLAAVDGGEHHDVEAIEVPGSYGRSGTPDVAILKLATPSTMKPIPLVSRVADWRPGSRSTVAGWGLTGEQGSPSHVLRHVHIPILRDAACRRAYGSEYRSASMLCAGIAKGGKDSCQGDSGGPLMVKGRTGQLRLAGVVSWGMGCARKRYPGVYSRVGAPRIQSWISTNVKR